MGYWWRILFVAILFAGIEEAFQCATDGNFKLPIVRNISEMKQDSYGYSGISHTTIAGSVMHGFKEIEVWHQTIAPGAETPIHRHPCEEIIVVLKGNGILRVASTSHLEYPGNPREYPIFANSTFHVPIDDAHQASNKNGHEDLQYLVLISRPPVNLSIYDDWFMPHSDAKLKFPMAWDEACYHEQPPFKDEL